MSAAVDPVAAIRTVLLDDPDVAALASTRVYGGDVPASAVSAMPQASVVLKPAGGPGVSEGFSEWGRSRVDIYCYGATLNQAWSLYLAVYGLLKQLTRQTVGSVLVQAVSPLSKGALGVDPDTQWPVTLSSWQVTASEVAAA